MAELVDALDSGSSRGNSVDVQLILAAFLLTQKAVYTTYSKSCVYQQFKEKRHY